MSSSIRHGEVTINGELVGTICPDGIFESTAAAEQRIYIVEIGGTRLAAIATANRTGAHIAQMACDIEPVSPALPDVDLRHVWPGATSPATNRAARRRAAKDQRSRA